MTFGELSVSWKESRRPMMAGVNLPGKFSSSEYQDYIFGMRFLKHVRDQLDQCHKEGKEESQATGSSEVDIALRIEDPDQYPGKLTAEVIQSEVVHG